MAETTEKTIADELREAAARLRSSKIDLATIEGLSEVVRVGGVPLARCVKCDCVARVDGEAVYQLLIVALLNAREPLASLLDHMADIAAYAAERGLRNAAAGQVAHTLAVARVLNGGPS